MIDVRMIDGLIDGLLMVHDGFSPAQPMLGIKSE